MRIISDEMMKAYLEARLLLALALVLFGLACLKPPLNDAQAAMFRPDLSNRNVPERLSFPLDQLWAYETDDITYSSPAVHRGMVYFGSNDGGVYALTVDGKKVWRYPAQFLVTSSPAVSDGIVYIGSWDKYLYALEEKTGRLLWRLKIGEVSGSSPIVSNGVVYIGAGHNVYAAKDA